MNSLGHMISALPDTLDEHDLKKLLAELIEYICDQQNIQLDPKAKEELIAGLTNSILSKAHGEAISKEAVLDAYYQDRPSLNFLQLITLSVALTAALEAHPQLKNTLSDLLTAQFIREHALEITRGEIKDLQLLTPAEQNQIRELSKEILNELENARMGNPDNNDQQTVDTMAVALLGLVANIAGAAEADKTSVKQIIFQLANQSIGSGSSLTPESTRDKPQMQLSTGVETLCAQVLDLMSLETLKDHMNASTPRLHPPGREE